MKKLFYLTIILVGLGMWLGINFARDQPLFSNPFADKAMADKARATAKIVAREAQEAVQKALDDKIQ